MAATDEKSLENALKTLAQAAHNDEVMLLLAERNSAAAQRPDIWHEKASSLGPLGF